MCLIHTLLCRAWICYAPCADEIYALSQSTLCASCTYYIESVLGAYVHTYIRMKRFATITQTPVAKRVPNQDSIGIIIHASHGPFTYKGKEGSSWYVPVIPHDYIE